MIKQITLFLLIFTFILSACGANADDSVSYPNVSYPNSSDGNSYVPQPSDTNLVRSGVEVVSTNLLTMESYPLQFMLSLKGSLPTPCSQLRIVASAPDAENKIFVDVYSVASPDQICAQVLSPFEVNYSLGSFGTGHYILFVNGSQIAEFDA